MPALGLGTSIARSRLLDEVTVIVPAVPQVFDLGVGEEFSAGVPHNYGVGSENGANYTVVYIDAASNLRALTTDMSTSTAQANVAVNGVNNTGRAHGCYYANVGGQWTLTMLCNTGDVEGLANDDNYFQWRQWAIDSNGNFGAETLVADAITEKDSGWAILGSDAYANLTATEFYGAVTGIEFGVETDSAATRYATADLTTRGGLGGVDFGRINFPEFIAVLALSDGYLCISLDNGGTGDQAGDFGVIQERTRPDLATAWSADVDIDGNIAGGTATTGQNQNYAINSSHAGQGTFCQIGDGRVFMAWVDNEDQVNGDFGRINLIERGSAIADGWTLRSTDVAGVSVRHVALSTDGNNLWIFYFKTTEDLAYKVWDATENTFSNEFLIETYSDTTNTLNRMTSGARFPSGVKPAVFYTTHGGGSSYQRYIATAPRITTITVNPALQYLASDAQTSGSDVVSLPDSIGTNDLNIVSGTPQIVSAGLNGEDYISFDSAYLSRSSYVGLPIGSTDRAMISVCRYRSAGWGGFAYGTSTNNQTSGLANSSGDFLAAQFWSTDLDSTVPGISSGWIVQAFIKDGNRIRLYRNNVLIIAGNRNNINTPSDGAIVVGAEINLGTLVSMDVAEMRIYGPDLNNVALLNVVNELMNKYGVT